MDTRELCGVLTVTVSFSGLNINVVLVFLYVAVMYLCCCVVLLNVLVGDTKSVLTGSADNSCRLWDCETGG